MHRTIRTLAVAVVTTLAAVLVTASAGHAAYPGSPGLVVFVRGGNLFFAQGTTVTQFTTGGGYDWPRLAPRGVPSIMSIAYVRNGDVYVATLNAGVPNIPIGLENIERLTTGQHAGAPSWSGDGTRLAWINGTAEIGTMFIVRFGGSTASAGIRPAGRPTMVIHTGRTGAAVRPAATAGFNPLMLAAALAWSPDSNFIAFPGGECTGIYDDCLSVVDVRTNVETTVRAFAGDGVEISGFSTVPAWTADGTQLLFTDQEQDFDTGLIGPVHVSSIAWPLAPGGMLPPATQVGNNGDVVPVPSAAGNGALLVTASHNGQSWVTWIRSNGVRTLLYQGYHQDWQSALTS